MFVGEVGDLQLQARTAGEFLIEAHISNRVAIRAYAREWFDTFTRAFQAKADACAFEKIVAGEPAGRVLWRVRQRTANQRSNIVFQDARVDVRVIKSRIPTPRQKAFDVAFKAATAGFADRQQGIRVRSGRPQQRIRAQDVFFVDLEKCARHKQTMIDEFSFHSDFDLIARLRVERAVRLRSLREDWRANEAVGVARIKCNLLDGFDDNACAS